jgi:hypothetical protein
MCMNARLKAFKRNRLRNASASALPRFRSIQKQSENKEPASLGHQRPYGFDNSYSCVRILIFLACNHITPDTINKHKPNDSIMLLLHFSAFALAPAYF